MKHVCILLAVFLFTACGKDAAPCVDKDFDGYGANCSRGSDCDDSDPNIQEGCDPGGSNQRQPCDLVPLQPDCPCDPGVPDARCYDGPAHSAGVGICVAGSMVCESGVWGACHGAVLPEERETCDDLDNNCDGRVDEGLRSSCGTCDLSCNLDGRGSESEVGFEPPDEDSGLEMDENGAIILGEGTHIEYNFLWVANAREGTVSKVDTRTLTEVGRYHSVGPNNTGLTPGGHNSPSRTAIDLAGSMFVANRAFGRQASVTKIGSDQCRDINGDSRIQTSRDANGNGEINLGDPNEFLGQADECFLWTSPVGADDGVARALAIDIGDGQNPHGNVWAGLFHHQSFVGLSGATGELLSRPGLTNPVTDLGHSPYGAVVDSNGYVWSGTISQGTIVGFDSVTGRKSGVIQPQGAPRSSYGITLDAKNRVWIGAQRVGVTRYDPYTAANGRRIEDPLAGGGAWANQACTGTCYMRGMGVDTSERIWVADNEGGVQAWNTNSLAHITNARVSGSAPVTGAGVDFFGYIWGVSGNGFTVRIDPDNPNDQTRVNVGAGPYTYSDFTGFGLRNFTAPRGIYRQVFISGCKENTHWAELRLSGDTPPQTRLEARVKVAPTEDDLADPNRSWTGGWLLAADQDDFPADLSALATDKVLLVEVALVRENPDLTPALTGLDVQYFCP